MELTELKVLLSHIKGCTFASLDAETSPSMGIRKVTTGQRVILFATNGASGYEAKVRRHLAAAGKDPLSFKVEELPWGKRVDNLPLIKHGDNYYLQCVILSPGETKYYIGNKEVDFIHLGLKERKNYNQRLPVEEQVFVSTYNLDNIIRISLMKETLTVERGHRTVLGIKT